MKRGILLVILILVLLPLCFSLSTDLRSSYSQKETIVIKVSGNILEPITFNSVEFKRNNVLLALDYGVVPLNGTYYIWAIAPSDAGNYTLHLKNIATTVQGIQKKIDFDQNFTVTENLTAYNVKPGVISTKTNFSIEVFSFDDSIRAIPIVFQDSYAFDLKPGKNIIDFNIDNVYKANLINLKIGGYILPSFIIGSSNPLIQYINPSSDLTFSPSLVSEYITNNSAFQKTVILFNEGNQTQKGALEFDSDLFKVEPSSFNLAPGENISIKITSIALTNDISRVISARAKSFTGLPISLSIRKTSIQNNNDVPNFCSEITNGVKCTSDETCIGSTQDSNEGQCCVGACQAKSSSGSTGWIIFIIVIVLIGIGGYVYYKYQHSPKNTGSLEQKIEDKPRKTALP